jgi:hypothetical protein
VQARIAHIADPVQSGDMAARCGLEETAWEGEGRPAPAPLSRGRAAVTAGAVDCTNSPPLPHPTSGSNRGERVDTPDTALIIKFN